MELKKGQQIQFTLYQGEDEAESEVCEMMAAGMIEDKMPIRLGENAPGLSMLVDRCIRVKEDQHYRLKTIYKVIAYGELV